MDHEPPIERNREVPRPWKTYGKWYERSWGWDGTPRFSSGILRLFKTRKSMGDVLKHMFLFFF